MYREDSRALELMGRDPDLWASEVRGHKMDVIQNASVPAAVSLHLINL
jgi:hypothetical protein